jgi:hypothetical protein
MFLGQFVSGHLNPSQTIQARLVKYEKRKISQLKLELLKIGLKKKQQKYLFFNL